MGKASLSQHKPRKARDRKQAGRYLHLRCLRVLPPAVPSTQSSRREGRHCRRAAEVGLSQLRRTGPQPALLRQCCEGQWYEGRYFERQFYEGQSYEEQCKEGQSFEGQCFEGQRDGAWRL